LLTNTT